MKRPQREGGQALVEFALTGVVFFTMVLFLLDGSRILWNQITLSAAASAGARYASLHGSAASSPQGPGSYESLKQSVRSQGFGLRQADLQIVATWEGNSNVAGHDVTVALTYSVRPVTTLFWSGLTLQLHATQTVEILR